MSVPLVVDGETEADSAIMNQIINAVNTNAAANAVAEAERVGLGSPNQGVLRLFPVMGVMGNPPAIAEGVGDASSVISGSVRIPAAAEAFVYSGCKADVFGQFYPNDDRYSPLHAAVTGDIIITGPWAVDFDWYGSEFEIEMAGSATAEYRITVDELGFDAREGRSELLSDGLTYLIHYDFTTTAFRRIRFDFSDSVKFGGVRIEPSASVWRSSKSLGPKVIVTGDSFAEASFRYWPSMMGELLGWRDISVVGKGSTGYLDTNSGGDTYRDRAQKDIYDQEPDIVVVSGGINDSNNTNEAAVGAEATTFYAEIKENLPDCILIVSGMQWPRGTLGGDTEARVAFSIRDAALASDAVDAYVDQLGLGTDAYSGDYTDYADLGWMTGLGKVGSTTGSGNADIFTSSDGTHPTQAGHDYRGWRHASALVAQMPIGAS